jgi:Na+/H+ antiporter NhaD/arsenite permease-like protein
MSQPADGASKTKKAAYKQHDPKVVLLTFGAVALVSYLCLHYRWIEQSYLFGLLLALTLGVLAAEKLNKVILLMLSAGLCLFLAVAEGGLHATAHVEHWKIPQYIAMIDWGTIGIIIGSTVFVELISRSGLFTFTSIKIMKLSQGDPLLLLVAFAGLTVVFSAFLNNVTAMIIIGSLTIVACRKLEIDPVPFLLTEGIFTNIGGLLTLISSVPNIIVGTEAKISYLKFLIVSGPYCLVASVATIAMTSWIFGVKRLASAEAREDARAQVERFDEWETVKDRKFFYLSAGVLIAIVLAFAFHSQLPVLHHMGLEVVAFIGATAMLVLYPTDVEEVLDRVEWSLIFFFVGLFALLGVMEHVGVLRLIGTWLEGPLGSGSISGPLALIWSSSLFSGLTDNIPLSAVLAKVLSSFGGSFEYMSTLWWALIFGAGLGGNLTPIGSASTVVAISIMKREGHSISFLGYVKVGAPIVLMQVALATLYLFLVAYLGLL